MAFLYSYGFIALAAFFKACADAFENTPNFNESIFKNWNKKFWCKDVSCEYAIKVFGYKIDSWHLSISLMICCWAAALVIYKPHHEWWVHYITIGVIWNLTFVGFYHKIFKVK